jgi:hypothetical protein
MDDETLEGGSENTTEDTEAGEGTEFERLTREIEENPGGPAFPRLAEAYRRGGDIERAESIAKDGLAEAPERMGGRVALALAMLDKGEITLASQELASILENIPELPSDSGEVALGESPEPVEHRLYTAPLASPSDALPHFDETLANDRSDDELRQDEIDNAFASAQTDTDEMVSPNRLAESAMLDADDESEASDDPDDDYSASDRQVFATATMATILEKQGDFTGAEQVRAAIPGEFEGQGETDAPILDESPIDTEATAPPVGLAPPVAAVPGPPESELDPDPRSELHSDLTTARAERAGRIINRLESWLANIRRDVA